MRYRLFLMVFLGFSLTSVTSVTGQRFSCTGQVMIATNDGNSTTISSPLFIPFGIPFLSPIARYWDTDLDAIGFNSLDNYIYAVVQGTTNIVRLSRNNSMEVIGSVDIVDQLRSNAGDCTADGLFVCHEYELNQLLFFEVGDNFELLQQVDLYWNPASVNSGPFTTRLYDFAIDPNNPGQAFAYQGKGEYEEFLPAATRGFMLQINVDRMSPDLGMVTPVEEIAGNGLSHLGGLAFYPDGSLNGFGSFGTELNPKQNTLYGINPSTGQISRILGANQRAVLSDGCSCPYSLNFINLAPGDGIYCNNDQREFLLTITNNSLQNLKEITLTDTLPEGMLIREVSGNFEGTVVAGTGPGFQDVQITDLVIPARSEIEITITFITIDAVVGPSSNQAYLTNLPERFNGVMGSDDPYTKGLRGDSSYFFVFTRRLEDVQWDITQPTDCLEANDGKIVVSSPQFFPGQAFEVQLRNKIGWAEYTHLVVIDENNSFQIDSLPPGEYQLFDFRPLSDNCSLALKDTVIYIEAPNDQLVLESGSNTPICDGETLILESKVTPAADIVWVGPGSFATIDPNPILDEVSDDKSGKYRVTATYGVCEQIDTLTIDVKSKITSSIEGVSELCARDSLKLNAVADDVMLDYTWTGPNGISANDSFLIMSNVTNEDGGLYEVISTNGACLDTATMYVIIKPTPTLELPVSISTDFCEPLVLNPALSGHTDVVYDWFPGEGLDCTNCPNPQVKPIVQNRYLLQVENEYQCSDSASVRIMLDKGNLITAPNIFKASSFNGNELFTIEPGCVVKAIEKLCIYNRWGNAVFCTESNDDVPSWNGITSGSLAESGVYVWFAKVVLVDGTIEFLTGDVTLLE